jgi:hypothetical protein
MNFAIACSSLMTAAEATLVVRVYRVGATYIRTLLGTASSAFNLGGVPNTFLQVNWAIALPEIIFEPGETIQYAFEVVSVGSAVTGRIYTLRFGTNIDGINIPRLSVLADTTGAATGLADATGITSKVLGVIGASSGFGDAQGTLGATATTTGVAAGAASAVGLGSSVAGAVGVADGSASAVGVGGKILGTVGAVDIGGGSVGVPAGSYIIDTPRQEYIHRLALLHGLDAGNPLLVSATARSAGGLVQSVDGTDTVTVTTTAVPVLSGNVDAWLEGLAAVHGINAALTVTGTSRNAGSVAQTISTDGATTTVARV